MILDFDELWNRLVGYVEESRGDEFADLYNLIFGTSITYNEVMDTFEVLE